MAEEYQIYGIYNHTNGKMYIGQTKQGYLRRFAQHCCPSENHLLHKAIKKYGKDNFSCELLDTADTRDIANEKEKMWIYVLKTFKQENGYNLSMGGEIGDFNAETLKKMSESKKGEKNSFFGKHHTDEAKKRMSEAKKKTYIRSGHPRSKRVKCVETGQIFECVLDAQDATGASSHHIGQVANGHGRNKAGGYRWEWA